MPSKPRADFDESLVSPKWRELLEVREDSDNRMEGTGHDPSADVFEELIIM
jgi:hypothetical protein